MPIERNVSKLSGYVPSLPTPFNEDDGLDLGAFERLCAFQVSEGSSSVDLYFACLSEAAFADQHAHNRAPHLSHDRGCLPFKNDVTRNRVLESDRFRRPERDAIDRYFRNESLVLSRTGCNR